MKPPAFSFATVQKFSIKKTKRKPKLARANTIDDIAKIVDPDAWGDASLSIEELQRLTAELSSIIEWLTAVPTTPEAEFNLIGAESQGRRYTNLDKLRSTAPQITERRRVATEKARNIYRIINAAKRQQSVRYFRRK